MDTPTMLNIGDSPGYFPHQKRTDKDKTEKFLKQCVDAGINIVNWNHNHTDSGTVRSSRENKIINYKIYNGDIDPKEIERVINPFKIQFGELPSSYRNYPLINPNIEVLLGEERKRFYKPMFINVNEDAVTSELERINDELVNISMSKIQSGQFSEEVAQRELAEFEKWRKYHFKDSGARMAGQVIDYLYRTLGLKEEFSRGFEDILIVAEEIYITDIIAGEPILRKANPLNVFTLRSGESYKIEDSDIIVEDGYIPIGEVIDRYHEFLSSKQIDAIERGYQTNSAISKDLFSSQLLHRDTTLAANFSAKDIGELIQASKQDTLNFGGTYDSEGNVRVTRTLWKGMRKIGIKEYTDEFGNYVREFVPEHYKPDTENGEEIIWEWVNEWYEGTRIGTDIYVKMGPKEVQMRSLDNPSKCHPGIVGSVVNVNNSTARSLVDSMKVYQLLYNAIMYRTENAIAKYLGKVGSIDNALIPDGWSMDQFLYYMYVMNIKVEDSFNEGQKGASTGKLVGGMAGRSNTTEIGDAQFIQQHLMILQFLESRVDQITGITPQRKGSIDNRETVGGVERSVMQSSHITEKWFGIHDDTRNRALLSLLETAKIAWNDRSFKRAYVLDNSTKAYLDFDGSKFKTTELGVALTTDSEDMNMMQAMKGLSQHLIQNQAPLSLVMEMYRTKDPESLKVKIMQWEEQQAEQAQAIQEAEQAAMQQAQELEAMKLELEAEQKELDRELEQYKIDTDAETKITVANINAYRHQEDLDLNNDGIPDPTQIADQAIKRLDVESKHFDKQKELSIKEKESQQKAELEKKKIELEEKKLKMQKEIQVAKDKAAMSREKLKARTALKNPVSGERKTTKKN